MVNRSSISQAKRYLCCSGGCRNLLCGNPSPEVPNRALYGRCWINRCLPVSRYRPRDLVEKSKPLRGTGEHDSRVLCVLDCGAVQVAATMVHHYLYLYSRDCTLLHCEPRYSATIGGNDGADSKPARLMSEINRMARHAV